MTVVHAMRDADDKLVGIAAAADAPVVAFPDRGVRARGRGSGELAASAPHLSGDRGDEGELGPLGVDRERVAEQRGGEPALR